MAEPGRDLGDVGKRMALALEVAFDLLQPVFGLLAAGFEALFLLRKLTLFERETLEHGGADRLLFPELGEAVAEIVPLAQRLGSGTGVFGEDARRLIQGA